MAKITERCPNCGNVVEGKVKRSTASKVTRNVIKKGGMKTVLGVAGTVVPGFGNVAGFIAGTAIDAIWGDKINNAVDDAADILVEDTNYSFTCPNCGHTWVHNESEQIGYTALEEGDEEEEYDEFIESNKVSREFLSSFIKDASICHYCLHIINSQPDGELDYAQIVMRVNYDIKIKVYDWQIKATTRQDVYEKLREILKCKSNDDLIFWHEIIATLPNGSRQEMYKMEVYNSLYVEELGYALIGVNTSGTINVGDAIVLRTFDDECYNAEVLWIEVFGKQLQSSESSETLGMGIDIDLGTIPCGIDCVYKYDEICNEEDTTTACTGIVACSLTKPHRDSRNVDTSHPVCLSSP